MAVRRDRVEWSGEMKRMGRGKEEGGGEKGRWCLANWLV